MAHWIEAARYAQKHTAQIVKVESDGGVTFKSWDGKVPRGWVLLDSTTASAIIAVYDKLNETNRAKFHALSLEKAISVAWKLVK